MRTGCIKTGCITHFPNYDQVLSVDVFRVGNCLVIRCHADQLNSDQGRDELSKPDLTIHSLPSGEEFWRTDLGVIVVPECYAQWTSANHP
jgi:hypothetical protein